MTGFSFRLSPSATRSERRERLDELRRLVKSGGYSVPAELIAEALLVDLGLGDPDCSSWPGQDADAT
jgi:hypothetical protein